MIDLEEMRVVVAIVATICGTLSFAAYLVHLWVAAQQAKAALATAVSAKQAEGATAITGASYAGIAAVINSLAALAEGLSKVGPALWSLLGSALFLLIAALAAGAFQSDAVQEPPSKPDANSASEQTTAGTTTGDQPADENLTVNKKKPK